MNRFRDPGIARGPVFVFITINSCQANTMTYGPNIIIHDFSQATAALEAAQACNQAVTLRSTPEAAAYLNPPVFKAMIDEAAAAVPNARFKAILDCGDQAGLVMNALRHGIQFIRADLKNDIYDKLFSMAKQSDAVIIRYDQTSTLDLGTVDDASTACQKWLKETEAPLT
jgi:fructose/tagatose bisphosphate aldolase